MFDGDVHWIGVVWHKEDLLMRECSFMRNNMACLRCGQTMNHIRTEKLQFGQTGWILGDLPNLLAGAMEVDIYSCPQCKKLEFFLAENKFIADNKKEESIKEEAPQKKCPLCGRKHDMEDDKCPFCNFAYPSLEWTKQDV